MVGGASGRGSPDTAGMGLRVAVEVVVVAALAYGGGGVLVVVVVVVVAVDDDGVVEDCGYALGFDAVTTPRAATTAAAHWLRNVGFLMGARLMCRLAAAAAWSGDMAREAIANCFAL